MNTEKSLSGKVALVTGASRGIGFSVAHRLAQMGASIAICSRDAKRIENSAAKLQAEGSKVLAMPADVAESAQVESFVKKAQQTLGPIDILVNNAGIGYFGPTHEASEDNWDAVLNTNLKSVFLFSRAVAPGMIERKTGHMINIASLAAKSAFPGGGIYCASKWGLLGLTQCMAEDLRPHGIRVSAICPGSVATEFSPHAGKDPRKMLQPEDIAHTVESIVTQEPQSFISEISLRPAQKP